MAVILSFGHRNSKTAQKYKIVSQIFLAKAKGAILINVLL